MKLLFLILSIIFAVTLAQKSCICPAVYQPVCSTSGRTYSNQCQLRCSKASLKHMGPC